MRTWITTLTCAALVWTGATAHAAFVVEIDTDGADDGVLTFSPNFGFGGDTTTASQSAASAAVGLTGGDSIFGGDGDAEPDTYLYTYDLDVDGDNLALTAGTALNDDGDTASGLTAGGSGPYNVYATWPFTENVSGGNTTFVLTDDMANELLNVSLDQNGLGDEWVLLGSVNLDAARTYTLSQEAGSNSFVSMRSAAVMFDAVPEPASVALLGLGGLVALARRRTA